MVDSRTEIFFLFSIFVVLQFYYFFSCFWSAFSFVTLWQQNRNIFGNIFCISEFFSFQFYYFFSCLWSAFSFVTLWQRSRNRICSTPKKRKGIQREHGAFIFKEYIFASYFCIARPFWSIQSKKPRSKFLTFHFHLICFLMLSTFKQAVASQDAMIPRE